MFSNNNKMSAEFGQMEHSDIYSQQHIIKPRRGASINRVGSKSKYAESMGKFKKDFLKESADNFYAIQLTAPNKKKYGPNETPHSETGHH